jgi:precorrin-2 dehydrogenase/sirohydrochlorin ferrochelatase
MTVPLALDLARLPVILAGAGRPLEKRLGLLDAERAPELAIYAIGAEPALVAAAGARLVARLPTEAEIAACRVLFVAGLPRDASANLAAIARTHRVLVNVEDDLPLCDFHVPAILRRGDLALSISTGGASPTLARLLKAWLGELLPESWDERLRRVAALRAELRAAGADPGKVAAATEALIDQENWLPNAPSEPAPPRGR